MLSLRTVFSNFILKFKKPLNTYTPAPSVENNRFSNSNIVSSVLSVQNGHSYVTTFVGSAQARQQVCPENLTTLELMLFLNLTTRQFANEKNLPVDPELPACEVNVQHEIIEGDISPYSLHKIIRNKDKQILKVMVNSSMSDVVKMACNLTYSNCRHATV